MRTTAVCLFLWKRHSFPSVLRFSQLDEIIRDPTPPEYGEEHLAALTAGERTQWAEARETFFRAGVNRTSLEAIEKSAFVLVLDDDDFEIGTVRWCLASWVSFPQWIENISCRIHCIDSFSYINSARASFVSATRFLHGNFSFRCPPITS